MTPRIDVLEAPAAVNQTNRYIGASYPGEGVYQIDDDLIVVVAGLAFNIPNGARLVVRQDVDAEFAQRAPVASVSEQTLLRAIVLVQRPELIKELPGA